MPKALINCIICALCCSFSLSYSQNKLQDLNLIQTDTKEINIPIHKLKPSFIQSINPIYWSYKGLEGLYKSQIKAPLSTTCVFEVNCSKFNRNLFREYGVFKSVFLSIDRLGRCNRLSYTQISPLSLNSKGKIKENTRDFTFKDEN